MTNSIQLREQSHWYLKIGTYLSAALSVVLFIIFWNISNPFWISIIRLAAFSFFALAVIGYLNVMNGPLTISSYLEDDKLVVKYRKKGKLMHEEEFDGSSVEEFFITKSQQNLIQRVFLPHSATLKVSFDDSENELFVFEFGGRPLFLEKAMLKKAKSFLQDHNFEVRN